MYNLILMRKNHFYFFKVFFTFLLLVTHAFLINAQETTRASNTRPAPVVKTPTALRSDVFVEKVMDVGPLGVRLLRNPKTGEFWYTAFDGSVFRIKGFDTKYPKTEKVFSSDDHGISRLQGATFYKNTLFLCGNMSANNGKGTKGRMVRYDLNRSRPVMNEVFNTVEYGTNATTYDHGWNALEISPDGKFIYVNTGARTDHGEVQDNQGAYPNARDNALTAKIYRFPIKTKNLLLVDDLTKMKAEGYIFAEGVRNAFDIAFDGSGKLFGVSNSPDYDMPEEMYWIRKGHHYGFPWVVGGIVNPQQYPDWKPDPATDPFISPGAHAWVVGYFRNDRDFPKAPAGVKFSPGIQNLGPAANEYREVSTGKIVDGDSTRVPVSTFNAHCVPMGLLFDIKKSLADDLKGDAFVFRYGGGRASSTNALLKEGRDLLHLDMSYNATADNFYTRTTRIVENFNAPVDAVIAGNKVYVLEYAGSEPGGRIWKITLPKDKKRPSKK